MIEYLSPREIADLAALADSGEAWPRLILEAFADAARLRLGWDAAQDERALAPVFAGATGAAEPLGSAERAALRAALDRAARWCAEHGLHLMSFEDTEFGDGSAAERRWFMAVG